MSAQHTPTPWRFYWGTDDHGDSDCGILSEIRPGHAYSVARCPRYQPREKWEADAEFIVRACNNFDSLVDALKQIANPKTFDFAARGIAEEALAKLRGQS